MKRSKKISGFLPSGCLTLEGLQKYRQGDCSAELRQKIAKHLKECGLCREAYEGLEFIPNSLKQREIIHDLRSDIKSRILLRERKEERGKFIFRKSNIVALAASIVFLIGIFSIYSYLLKKDRPYYAMEEKSSSGRDTTMNTRTIPSTAPENRKLITVIPEEQLKEENKNKIETTTKPGIKSKPIPVPEKIIPSQPLAMAQDSEETITLDDEGFSGIKEAENTLEVASYPVQNKKDNYKVHSKGIPVSSLQENNDKMETAKSAGIMMTMEKKYQPARFENSSYADFDDYLRKNLQYSDTLTKTRIQDTVLIECTISREGFIKNCKIINKINRLLDQEALRVLKNSPRWIPAKEKGIAVKQKHVFTIVFWAPQTTSEK